MKVILFILFATLLCQESYDTTLVITNYSSIITHDAKNPEIENIFPDGGEVLYPGHEIQMSWEVNDDSFDNDPIQIYGSFYLGGYFVDISDLLFNSGFYNYTIPNINSPFVLFKFVATDEFGNYSEKISSSYIRVGDDIIGNYEVPVWLSGNEGQQVEIFFDHEYYSINNIHDAKYPEIELLYPNGGENIDFNNIINLEWLANDDSFGGQDISFYLSTDLGGTFNEILSFIPNTGIVEVNMPSVNESFARIKVIAEDVYGNISVDYSDSYFQLGDGSIIDYDFIGYDSINIYNSNYDTLFIDDLISSNFIHDSKIPNIEWLSPNGGEQFDNYATITVEWFAEDESFGDDAISIYLSTELGGYYNSMVEGVPNTELYDIELPSADEAFARFKIIATDIFGNISQDYADNYFILGDPFGDYNVNPLDDIIVIDWGWGEYQMIYVENDALNFLNEGDEIHVIDQNGIIANDCLDEERYGVVSVASYPYIANSNIPYGLYSIGGVDYCEESDYIQRGYVEGNQIYFAHYDDSENVLNYLDPEYDSGNGLFGVEFKDTLRFEFYDQSENTIYVLNEEIIFSPNMIEGNAINPISFSIDYSSGVPGTPNWFFNWQDYEFSGNITSAIYESGDLVIESGDKLAAFVNNSCRGIVDAVDTPNPMFEDVVFMLSVWGNQPITVVSSFNEVMSRSANYNGIKAPNNRNLNSFNIYRNNSLIVESIDQFYYMDNDALEGEDYCYQVVLLDDEGIELLESIEQCIGSSEEIIYLSGDVTEDGELNILDIVLMIDWIVNEIDLSEIEIAIGDMTDDNLINVLDIVALMDTILNP